MVVLTNNVWESSNDRGSNACFFVCYHVQYFTVELTCHPLYNLSSDWDAIEQKSTGQRKGAITAKNEI